MKRDFVTTEFENIWPLLQEISAVEEEVEEAKSRGNRDEKKRLERELKAKRGEVARYAPTTGRWYLEATEIADDSGILEAWREDLIQSPQGPWAVLPKLLQEWIQRTWMSTKTDLSILPPYSFLIHFTFRLRKPYLSKADTEFYIIDNPVRKDKVFKLPYVAPTGWKGALRAAIRLKKQQEDTGWQEKNDKQTYRLFGNVKAEEREDYLRSGRLVFFPTFFKQISLEVINPHDRETGAGKQPIYIESVPIGAEGIFTLLYVPFDRIGQEEANPEENILSLQDEVVSDLDTITQGVRAMFTEYGFGAKTSSGFGTAEILSETVTLRLQDGDELSEEVLKAKEKLIGEKEVSNE